MDGFEDALHLAMGRARMCMRLTHHTPLEKKIQNSQLPIYLFICASPRKAYSWRIDVYMFDVPTLRILLKLHCSIHMSIFF